MLSTATLPDSVLVPSLLLVGLGVPHGALDMLLWRRAGARSPARFVAAYLAIAMGVGVAFWCFPAWTLTGFLLMSALHFGEGDHQQSGSGAHSPLAEILCRGLLPLAMPFLAWPHTVAALIAPLLPGWSAVECLIYTRLWGELATLTSVGAAVWLVTRTPPREWPAGRRRALAAELVAVLAVTSLLHPLLGFAVYFACLHSARHVRRVWRHLGPDLGRGRPARGRALALLLGVCGITAAGTLVGGRLVAAHTPLEWWRVILTGLAALTAPHALVVLRTLREPQRVRPTRLAVALGVST